MSGRILVSETSGPEEPEVSVEAFARALEGEDIETLRPLLPVGYRAGVDAYRAAASRLDADTLSSHYTAGLSWFHDSFVPTLVRRVEGLVDGAWDLSKHRAYAAGSDVDLIAHVVNAATLRGSVNVFPGDWWGFVSGALSPSAVRFAPNASAACLAAACVPSVRNGHTTDHMIAFLASAPLRLLNVNLLPTMRRDERVELARRLSPLLERSLVSISFSRGFGLTASQLGVLLAPPETVRSLGLERPLEWTTFFYNRIAAEAFLEIDLDSLASVDDARRAHVARWLDERELPSITTGSYYVKAFRVVGELPARLVPLARDGLARVCLKPPIS
ncbi:MAG: hypothetical protein HYV07_29195 [Deltaproteobacteria bacterium]|nr:hypothetical protein [Deltaproteobacteria bacterium]